MSKNIPKFDRKIAPKWTPKPSQNPPKIDPGATLGPEMRQSWSKSDPGPSFWRFWDDFWSILGRFWTDFGTILDRVWDDASSILERYKKLSPPNRPLHQGAWSTMHRFPQPRVLFFVVVAVWLRFEIHNLELNPPTQNLELRSKIQDLEFKILNPLSPFWAGGFREAITI